MSSFIQPWMQGHNLQISFTLITALDSVGGITTGSTVSFIGRLSDDGQTSETVWTTNPISPMDCSEENDVDVMQSTSYNVSEFMNPSISSLSANGLDFIARNCRYGYLTLTGIGQTLSGNQWVAGATVRSEVGLVKWNRYNPTYRKGDAKGMMAFKTVAVGNGSGGFTANPSVAD